MKKDRQITFTAIFEEEILPLFSGHDSVAKNDLASRRQAFLIKYRLFDCDPKKESDRLMQIILQKKF